MNNIPGNPREWDDIWTSLDRSHQSMFTRGSPSTIRQFWQKCYFDDLYNLVGTMKRGDKFLELGAGRGTTSLYLADKGCDVTLLDLSEAGLEMAKRNFLAAGVEEPKVICTDATKTGLPDEQYSCIYNIGLLEHFVDPTAIIAESHRLLQPGGLLFSVIVPRNPYYKRWLASILFAPWKVPIWYLKSLVKRMISWDGDQKTNDMVRTDHNRKYYIDCAKHLGWTSLDCISYNPYHTLYNLNDAWPIIGAYKLHHRSKRSYPKLATFAAVSLCDLLIATK